MLCQEISEIGAGLLVQRLKRATEPSELCRKSDIIRIGCRVRSRKQQGIKLVAIMSRIEMHYKLQRIGSWALLVGSQNAGFGAGYLDCRCMIRKIQVQHIKSAGGRPHPFPR